jgi:hypothetical protein
MKAGYSKRLEKLERTQSSDLARLTLPDGKVVTVLDTGELVRACGREIQGLPLNAEQQALVDLVKQSVDSREAGGGQMIEVYRAILLSPVADEFYPQRREVAAGASAAAPICPNLSQSPGEPLKPACCE